MLTRLDIFKITNGYIGVSSGYLGDFSYRTHAEFYPLYCNLDIDPNQYPGTTRERFITILSNSDTSTQAAILKGVLERFPLALFPEETRDEKLRLREEIEGMISRLEGQCPIADPTLEITSEVVERAITDAQVLIERNGATSAVDRIHTALHGYLKAVCRVQNIQFSDSASITLLFKMLRENHPSFSNLGSGQTNVDRIVRAISNILDALNPVRNNESVAHPNDELLDVEEAMFVINSAKSILHYLNSKIKNSA